MDKKKIKQHNSITEARYEMSALEKNIFYMLLAQLKEDDPPEKAYYRISFDELESRLGRKIPVSELIKASQNLVLKPYTIQKETGGVFYASLVSSMANLPKENAIQLGVGSMIRPYLFDLKRNYTEFELDMALQLRSKYSKRMYEMLSQHKVAGGFVISVEELKWRFALKDPKTGKEKYSSWSTFKEQILETPQKELTEKADITFTYQVTKTGKKYTHLHFNIIDAKQSPRIINSDEPDGSAKQTYLF
jgi:plasmid replication initiation protein